MLALFDLDGFKRYNDTFGHPSGDALLVRLAGGWPTRSRPGSAYRMGGDEFCAILEGDERRRGRRRSRERATALAEHGDALLDHQLVGYRGVPGRGAQRRPRPCASPTRRMYVA